MSNECFISVQTKIKKQKSNDSIGFHNESNYKTVLEYLYQKACVNCMTLE